MLGTLKITPVNNTLRVEIREGNQTITPQMARLILRDYSYGPQAARTQTGELYIGRWTRIVNDGQWIPYSQINFGRVGNELYLLNGYHRLTGLSNARNAATFNVQLMNFDTEKDLNEYYARFDLKGVTRNRSDQQALSAFGFLEDIGISATLRREIDRAIPLIMNDLAPLQSKDLTAKRDSGLPYVRLEKAKFYESEAQTWDTILAYASAGLKKRLQKAPITAVALVLLKFQGDAAVAFLSAVANNSGLVKGEPEHYLVQRLMEDTGVQPVEWRMKLIAAAWNARYDGQSRGKLQPNAMKSVHLRGTPYFRDRFDD